MSVATRPSGTTSTELDASLISNMSRGLGPGQGPWRSSRSLSLDATLVVATGCSPHMAAILVQYAQRRESVMMAIEMHTDPAHPHPYPQLQPHPQLQPLTSAPAECPPGPPRLAIEATAFPTPPSCTSGSPSACEDPTCGTRAGHALELASRTSSVAHRVIYPQLHTFLILRVPYTLTVLQISKQKAIHM